MLRNGPPRATGANQGYGSQIYPPSQQYSQVSQYGQQGQGQNQQHLQNAQIQQQQQQQQQHHQGQGAQSVNGTADGASGSASAPGQEMNLASVLHYLQSEWRRWERDRNEWEIERAEMRARIALLEGQRRSAENLKVDLLRRVKMLEYALRQERTKTVSSGGKSSSLAPARLSTLQDEDKSVRDDKEGSGSEGSQEEAERLPKANGIHPAAISKTSSVAERRPQDSSTWKNIGSAQRDPKSRARSREYLKQCLQEISYLTSPGALNPLPPRPPIDSTFIQSESEQQAAASVEVPDRPRKSMPEQSIPSTYVAHDATDTQPTDRELPNGATEESAAQSSSSAASASSSSHSTAAAPQSKQPSPPSAPHRKLEPEPHSMAIEPTARPPSSPAPRTMSLPDTDAPPSDDEEDHSKQILTAIYRPDSKAAWREELRAANEMAEKAKDDKSRQAPEQNDDDQLANLTLNADDDEIKPEEVIEKVWTGRRTLKSHLCIVRAIAFAHGAEILLATGSDDNTVKVWAIETASVMSQKASANEPEPIITLRGHTAGITAVTISTSSPNTYGSAQVNAILSHPTLPAIITAHEDGHIQFYDANSKSSAPTHTVLAHPAPVTSLSISPLSPTFILTASSDCSVRLWDLGKKTSVQDLSGHRKRADEGVCAVASHPELPVIGTAGADGVVRLWGAG